MHKGRPTKEEEDERSLQRWVDIILSDKQHSVTERNEAFSDAFDATMRQNYREMPLAELYRRRELVVEVSDPSDSRGLTLIDEVIKEREGENNE